MPKPIPAAYFKDRAAFDTFIRHDFIRHPFFIAVMSCSLVFKLLGMIVPEFYTLNRPTDVGLLALRLVAFVGVFAWLFPAVLWRLLPRNIPYVVIEHGFFFVVCIPSALLLFPFHDETVLQALKRFGGQQCYALVLTYLLVLFFERSIRAHLGNRPECVPVFWPVRLPDERQAEALYLASDLKGLVLVMQAQNQYVQITTSAERCLLRMTLSQAIASMPQGTGLRVHRSWWVSRAYLQGMIFNSKSMILNGDTVAIPVSKAARDEVMNLTAANTATQDRGKQAWAEAVIAAPTEIGS